MGRRPGVARPAHALVGVLVFVALLAGARTAFADRVVVVPVRESGGATPPIAPQRVLEEARASLTRLGHEVVVADERTEDASAQDGTVDTTEEYRAATQATGAAWAVGGTVSPRDEGVARVELEAYQAKSGRLESLARDASEQNLGGTLDQMLGLLVREEGLGTQPAAWPPPTPPKPAEPAPKPVGLVPAEQPQPAKPSFPRSGRFRLAGGALFTGALARPTGAQGSSFAVHPALDLTYFLADPIGVRVQGGASVVGPGSGFATVGGKALVGLVPIGAGMRPYAIYGGADLGIGAFILSGAKSEARFLVSGEIPVGVVLDRLFLEATANAMVAPGPGGALVLFGGGARVGYLF